MKNTNARQVVGKIIAHCKDLPVGPHFNTRALADSLGFSPTSFGTGLRYDTLTPFRIFMDGQLWWGNSSTITLLKDGLGAKA